MAHAFRYIAGTMRSEKTQVPIAGFALVAVVAMTLTGCGPAKTVVAAPKLICNIGTPSGGFETASSAARLIQTTATFPKVGGTAVDVFGKADAQAALEAGFSTVYNLNILGKMWAPNLNKDPKFIPALEAELKTYSPYFCGTMKTKFLATIPDIVNPTTTKKDAKGKTVVSDKTGINAWRGMFGLPDRLANGTLPPTSKAADDLEMVAPFSFGQRILGKPIVKIENNAAYKGLGQVISFRFTWQSDLVYGTKTSIEWQQPLKRDITIMMVKNPDAISAKDFPYVMVDFSSRPVTAKDSFGEMTKHHAPLVEPAPK